MKSAYDLLFITHLPAFYKVNLYNHLAKQLRVCVIFVSATSTIRTTDFTKNDIHFDYFILNEKSFEKRNPIVSLVKLFKLIRRLTYRKLVVGGWDLPEFWLATLFSSSVQNQLALESCIFESKTQGFAAWLKRLFLKRIHLAYPSGKPHQDLLLALGFKGKIKQTNGVGLFNYKTAFHKKSFSGKFLFVGRLAPEKNLSLLICVFAELPHFSLTLAGQGPLQKILEKQLTPNIKMLGHIDNASLAQLYESHDVLILPSLREPWGLVVEEALFHGLPVIVSDKVGCAQDLVTHYQVGLQFKADEPLSLANALFWISQHYDICALNIASIDFAQKEAHQIQQYIEALS